jgi:hypothetical protein
MLHKDFVSFKIASLLESHPRHRLPVPGCDWLSLMDGIAHSRICEQGSNGLNRDALDGVLETLLRWMSFVCETQDPVSTPVDILCHDYS